MPDFPDFIRRDANRIDRASEYTEDIEGYVFDGVDGSQVAFWKCSSDRISEEHAHAFDEYVLVVEGRCVVFLGDRRLELGPGEECFVPANTRQRMQVSAGTRTIHVFGAKRARRVGE